MENKALDLDVSEHDAKEMAYHYLRTHNFEKMRPIAASKEAANGKGEPIWVVELAERVTGKKAGSMKIGSRTGSTYSFEKVEA
jgi:hypothetical protein